MFYPLSPRPGYGNQRVNVASEIISFWVWVLTPAIVEPFLWALHLGLIRLHLLVKVSFGL
jgi:hypothetical protein